MKKIILTISIMLFLTIIFFEHLYPKTMKIIHINYETDIVTCEDVNGFVWEFTGVEDYCENDYIACIMFDNYTNTIFDDKIEIVKYENLKK
jgi:hypothetical protein